MEAIILAAGLGSRLKEVTKDIPKALVTVNGITMLESVIDKLKKQGISRFIINIHHHGEKIIDFINSKNNFGVDIIISDERKLLLNTGGAILKAAEFINGNENILVHNVDIVSEIDIHGLEEFHISNNCLASLCVRHRNTNRFLLFNQNMKLVGWTNELKGEFRWVDGKQNKMQQFAFNGIYMISPQFINHIHQHGNFSIIDTWLDIAKSENIMGFVDRSPVWHDLGTIDRIKNLENN